MNAPTPETTRPTETPKPPDAPSNDESRRDNLAIAALLIGLGAFFLLAQVFDAGNLVLPVLAAGFLVTGVITREAGWMIPGGILGGVAFGAYANDAIPAGEDARGGVFLLAFAAGWVSITSRSSSPARRSGGRSSQPRSWPSSAARS